MNRWETGKTTYGIYTNDHTTWVQEEDRGGGDARQASHTPKKIKIPLTLWHTQTAESRSEPPMSLLLVLAFCQ
jgi:hypothetical protein